MDKVLNDLNPLSLDPLPTNNGPFIIVTRLNSLTIEAHCIRPIDADVFMMLLSQIADVSATLYCDGQVLRTFEAFTNRTPGQAHRRRGKVIPTPQTTRAQPETDK